MTRPVLDQLAIKHVRRAGNIQARHYAPGATL